MNNKKGFTFLHALLAFFIVMHASYLLTLSLSTIVHTIKDPRIIDVNIGIDQLRLLLAASEDIKLEGNCITFLYKNKQSRLEIDQNRIVKRPGFVIYLSKIKDAHFMQEGDDYYLIYGPKQERRLLYEE